MVGVLAHLFGESSGVRSAENQLGPKPFFYFYTESAIGVDGARGAVHNQVIRAELRDFLYKHVMVPFFQTAIKKLYFVFGVPFQDGRTISQLPRIIGEYIVVFGAVGPATGEWIMAYPSASIPTELQTATFIDFLLQGERYFYFRFNSTMLQALFQEPEMGIPDLESLKLITAEIN